MEEEVLVVLMLLKRYMNMNKRKHRSDQVCIGREKEGRTWDEQLRSSFSNRISRTLEGVRPCSRRVTGGGGGGDRARLLGAVLGGGGGCSGRLQRGG
jgi:hypothetical protein